MHTSQAGSVAPARATTYALVHATTFEGQTIGNGGAGPIFTQLLDAWKQSVGVDFVAQARDYAQRLLAWDEKQSNRER